MSKNVKRYCTVCGDPIFNKQPHSSYCNRCSLMKTWVRNYFHGRLLNYVKVKKLKKEIKKYVKNDCLR